MATVLQGENVPVVQSKDDLFKILALAENCMASEDFPKSCRYLEILKALSVGQPQISDVDWNSTDVKLLISKCTRMLAMAYFELKMFRSVVPLLEKSIWNEPFDYQNFFADATLLSKSYINLEEYRGAQAVATLILKRLPDCIIDDKKVEINTLLAVTDAYLRAHHDQFQVLTSLCDKSLSLTRDGAFPEERIRTFLAKSEIALATNNFQGALVFSEQAIALAKSSKRNDLSTVANAKIILVEVLLSDNRYDDAIRLLEEINNLARSDTNIGTNKMTLARVNYYSGLCLMKLHGLLDSEICCQRLQKAAKLAVSAKMVNDQSLLISIWELLAEIYHNSPDFVQMEHGHKCMLQILSDGINRLLRLVNLCECVPEALLAVINKACRLYLELECSLTDPKATLDTVEWVRDCILLAKVPCRRLVNKLNQPVTRSRIEQLIGRYSKNCLFIYFADVGKDSSQAICTWVLSPEKGCLCFHKTATASVGKYGKTLPELIANCLLARASDEYSSERRLLPLASSNKKTQNALPKAGDDDVNFLLAQLAELLFSKITSFFTDEITNVYVFPDGPLLALSSLFGELVNLWIKTAFPDPPPAFRNVFSLPSILFLEICLENQIATLVQEQNHTQYVQDSKLGGLHLFFQNQKQARPPKAKPVSVTRSFDGVSALVRPRSGKVALGAHTISTLTTNSSSGGDICSSSLYCLASSNLSILPNKAVFFGNPSLPADVPIGGSSWHPPLLSVSQKEILQLSKQIHSPYVYLGTQCTKDVFLKCCHESSLVHLATYVSYVDGVVAFSCSSSEMHDSSGSDAKNAFSPLDVSGFKLIPSEIATLPLSHAKLVTVSAPQSTAQLMQTIEFSRNHIGNSIYILPASFLLAGAHSVLIPQLGLTDKQLVDGFCHLYAKGQLCNVGKFNNSEPYFCSVVGISSLLDMKRLSHGMLDQQIQQVTSKSQEEIARLTENNVFVSDDSEVSHSLWFGKLKQLICWSAKNRLPAEELIVMKRIIQNQAKIAELDQLPETYELQLFLKWLGYHVTSIDKQLTLVLSPLQNHQKKLGKVLLLLDVLHELFFCDSVLCDAAIDLMEYLSISDVLDFLIFFSLMKHTSFLIETKDETASRLFENHRYRSFLYLLGFFSFRGAVIFRASPGNCRRLEIAFKLAVAMSYAAPNEVLSKFVPAGDYQPTEAKTPTDGHIKLRSLNYVAVDGPTIANSGGPSMPKRRIIAAEPIFHQQIKSELDTKLQLADGMRTTIKDSSDQLKAAKSNYKEQINLFDKVAPTVMHRNISKLSNHIISDRVKVEAGGTPSQTRVPIGYYPPVSTSDLNNERKNLQQFFESTLKSTELTQRQKIEKLVEKYTNRNPVSSS